MNGSDGRGLALAVAAAFSASMLAIQGHADQVEQGYRLAAARREGEVLRREAIQAERRVASLRIPTGVAQRATAMQLGLALPRDRRVVTEAEVAALLAPPPAPTPLSPTPVPLASVAQAGRTTGAAPATPPAPAPSAAGVPPAAPRARPPVPPSEVQAK